MQSNETHSHQRRLVGIVDRVWALATRVRAIRAIIDESVHAQGHHWLVGAGTADASQDLLTLYIDL